MRERVPGDLLLRPVPFAAALALVLNDHLLKRELADSVTGKVSDVAGLVLVPLLAVSVLEIARWIVRKEWHASPRDLIYCLIAVGLVFSVAKVSPMVAHGFGDGLGVVRYPVRGRFSRVVITHDITDLAALPALLVAWLDGSRAIRPQRFASRPRPCTQTSGYESRT